MPFMDEVFDNLHDFEFEIPDEILAHESMGELEADKGWFTDWAETFASDTGTFLIQKQEKNHQTNVKTHGFTTKTFFCF